MMKASSWPEVLQALDVFNQFLEGKHQFIQEIKNGIADLDARVHADMMLEDKMRSLRGDPGISDGERKILEAHDAEVKRVQQLLALEKENLISQPERAEMHSLLDKHFLLKAVRLNQLTSYRKARLDALKKAAKDRELSASESAEMERLAIEIERTAGMESGRTTGYKLPTDLSPHKLAEIDEFRKYLVSLHYKPDDVYTIEGHSTSAWQLPMKVECFNITREQLRQLGERKFHEGRIIKYASVHGASHSIALIAAIIEEGLDVDFYYHANLEMEMPNEYDYVKYVMLHVLKDKKLPLVVVSRGESLHDIFYAKGAFPTVFKRWCTDLLKIAPVKACMHDLWDYLIYDEIEYGDEAIENRKQALAKLVAELDASKRLDDLQVERLKLLRRKKNAKAERNKATEEELAEFARLNAIWQQMITEKQLRLEIQTKKKHTRNLNISKMWRGQSIVIMQMLGIQHHQSPGRSRMIPTPVVSGITAEDFIVFDTLPVYRPFGKHLADPDYNPDEPETFNVVLMKAIGAKLNPNLARFGRHGCSICPFSGVFFFQHLKDTESAMHARAIEIRDWSNEKYGDPTKEPYVVFRLGKEFSLDAMKKYEERTGVKITESPF